MQVFWIRQCSMHRLVQGFQTDLFRSISSCSQASFRTLDCSSCGKLNCRSKQRRRIRSWPWLVQLAYILQSWQGLVGRMRWGCWFGSASSQDSKDNHLNSAILPWIRGLVFVPDVRDLKSKLVRWHCSIYGDHQLTAYPTELPDPSSRLSKSLSNSFGLVRAPVVFHSHFYNQ